MQRRSFLRGVVAGGAAAACSSETAARARALARLEALEGVGPDRDLERSEVAGELDRLADEILATDADELSSKALGWLDGDWTERDILSAAYLAGLREIDPSPIGGQVHALMMVASAAVAVAELPAAERALPVLFHLQRVKRSVRRDESGDGGDWVMPPPPAQDGGTRAEHIAAFEGAMQKWDEPAGDRAATMLHGELSMREFFELLWPWAVRDFRIIGHKMIFAVQTFRALEDLGWRLGQAGARSLVRGVLDQNPYGRFADDESRRILAGFEQNRERIAGIPAGWQRGSDDPDKSFRLLEQLRDATLADAAPAVVLHLQRGVGERAVWDGIRLTAFELAMRHDDIAGMHPVTSVNALWRGCRITNDESTRRLCLLQAADWMVLFRDFLLARGPRDLRVARAPAGRTGDPFAASSEAGARELAGSAIADPRVFRQRAIGLLARKAVHDHDYKVTIAALEELTAAHPACRPALAAASMTFLRRRGGADHAVVADWQRHRRG